MKDDTSDEKPGGSSSAAPAQKGAVAGAQGAGDEATFLVIAVGASAGGVEAFRQLLRGLDPDLNAALVLVLHLGEAKSLLTEILSRDSPLPVEEVEEGTKVVPGRVFVMPSGVDMTIEHRTLHLTARTAAPYVHTPIDLFFRSLAADQGTAAVGVVLTGADADGTLGLGAIKANGGVTLVQDPHTASYPSMPQHAVDAGVADLVVSLQDMPRELSRLSLTPGMDLLSPVAQGKQTEDLKGTFARILDILRRRTGVDFSRYKDSTIRRRIQRRMVILRIGSLADYLRRLEQDADEAELLYQDILIMVTQFSASRKPSICS